VEPQRDCNVPVVYGAMDGPGDLKKERGCYLCVVVGLVVHKQCVWCMVCVCNVGVHMCMNRYYN
jgi:hypothetical protein